MRQYRLYLLLCKNPSSLCSEGLPKLTELAYVESYRFSFPGATYVDRVRTGLFQMGNLEFLGSNHLQCISVGYLARLIKGLLLMYIVHDILGCGRSRRWR